VISAAYDVVRPSLASLRSRWLVVVTVGALGMGLASLYSVTTPVSYRATATMLVSPVPASDPTFLGIDVLKNDGGRQGAAATAARLVTTPKVAEAARARLGLSLSDVLRSVSAHAVGRSSAVAVTATDQDPARAAQLANAVVEATIAARDARFQSEVTSAIVRLSTQLDALPADQRSTGIGQSLQDRIVSLQALVGAHDPTLRHASNAVTPSSASWPKPRLLALFGALVGIGLGALIVAAAAIRPALENWSQRRESRRANEAATALHERDRLLASREEALAARQEDLAREAAEQTEELERRAEALVEQESEQDRRAASLAAAEAELERRAEAVAGEEGEQVRRAASLAAAEAELERRAEAVAGEEGEQDRRAASLAAAEAELERRAEAVAGQEGEQARRAAQLAAGEAEVEQRAAALSDREHRVARSQPSGENRPPEPERDASALPPPPSVPGESGTWTLEDLRGHVERLGAAHPDRLDEWSSYLLLLGDYADAEGRIPSKFDWLIEETFGELAEKR
jgi:capsular polysaccharide biosynthesis protein